MTTSELYQIYLQYPSIQTDTRKLVEKDLFFALRGPSFNGNEFAASALANGAAYAVVDDPNVATGNQYILVPDVLVALQDLARMHRMQFNIPFLAITGSNGKTTTKELITAVLKQSFNTYATEGNLNNHIGIPLTLLKIRSDAEFAVIEMGANHLKEIEGYCRIALPTYGLITNCGKAHIEGFGGIEGVRKGKGELYDFLRESGGAIFRNTILDYLIDMSKGIVGQITYGTANSTYNGRPLTSDIQLQVAILAANFESLIKTNLVGDYNFPNVMAAVAVGLHFGIPIGNIKNAIESYNPDNSRSQWLQRGTNRIILDAYNANPASMRAAILNFASASLPNKVLWIGGMKEMGVDEVAEHSELVSLIAEYSWNEVILVGHEFKVVKGNFTWFENSAEAARYVQAHPPIDQSILIKGSRGSKMEVLLAAIPV